MKLKERIQTFLSSGKTLTYTAALIGMTALSSFSQDVYGQRATFSTDSKTQQTLSANGNCSFRHFAGYFDNQTRDGTDRTEIKSNGSVEIRHYNVEGQLTETTNLGNAVSYTAVTLNQGLRSNKPYNQIVRQTTQGTYYQMFSSATVQTSTGSRIRFRSNPATYTEILCKPKTNN